jgi:hypothetical protein
MTEFVIRRKVLVQQRDDIGIARVVSSLMLQQQEEPPGLGQRWYFDR